METDAPGRPEPPLALLDTDVLCRYLLNDYPGTLSARCGALIESERPFRVSLLTLAEVTHVLRSVYHRSAEQIATALILLLERENIETHEIDTELAIEALELTRPNRRDSLPDALLWALAKNAGAQVWTLDGKFPSDGIEVQEPEGLNR